MEPVVYLALAVSLSVCSGGCAPAAPARSALQAEADHGAELEVPFVCGAEVEVSQGHGTFSHVGIDRWAWDFRVPDGTAVVAAHDGVVRRVRSGSTRGGCDRSFGPDANYVILSRGDGLETQYLHFSKVFVTEGQRVRAGTVLGEVGRTGFSCGPHLHFQLQRESRAWAGQSVPARFRDIGDPRASQVIVSGNCPRLAPTEPPGSRAPHRFSIGARMR